MKRKLLALNLAILLLLPLASFAIPQDDIIPEAIMESSAELENEAEGSREEPGVEPPLQEGVEVEPVLTEKLGEELQGQPVEAVEFKSSGNGQTRENGRGITRPAEVVGNKEAVRLEALRDIKRGGHQETSARSVSALSMPDLITVGNSSFYNNTNKSGSGWDYYASNNTLYLDNYNGTSIRTSGDLSIYTNGNVRVTGTSGVYGQTALSVGGNLDIYVNSGMATFTGGDGNMSSGIGIDCKYAYIVGDDGTTLNINGGNGGSSGGEGIYGYDIILSGDKVNITGGRGNEGGGPGIFALDLRIFSSNATITGGYGSSWGGDGICGASVYMYPDRATVTGGNSSGFMGYGIGFLITYIYRIVKWM